MVVSKTVLLHTHYSSITLH